MINSITVIAISLWGFFFMIEFKQMIKNPIAYVTDYANWLDMASQACSISYFMVLDYTILTDIIIVRIENLRIWGGAACMLMWIRFFQWMRLFK